MLLITGNQDGWVKRLSAQYNILNFREEKRIFVNGNVISFVSESEVLTRGDEYYNERFFKLFSQLNQEADDFNQKWQEYANKITEMMLEIEGDLKQAKRYDELRKLRNEVLSMKKDIPYPEIRVDGEWGIIYEDEFIPKRIKEKDVIDTRITAREYSLITGKFLGEIEYSEIYYSNEIDGTAAQPLFPLSKFSGKFEEWNETFKHKGSKIRIHRASVENGTCEDVIRLIDSLS